MDRHAPVRAPRALLVDDDAVTRKLHAGLLARRGYDVTTSPSSSTGLREAQRSRPEAIFVHLGGKGWGGSAFIQELRADDATRHVPVVILASEYDRNLRRLKLTTHADGFW
jgi:chemosensory pili system protein ChpA (sensor histidine kinase/response regulator)